MMLKDVTDVWQEIIWQALSSASHGATSLQHPPGRCGNVPALSASALRHVALKLLGALVFLHSQGATGDGVATCFGECAESEYTRCVACGHQTR